MAAVPNSDVAPPLPREDLHALRTAVAEFNYDQLLWASGYLAGLARTTVAAAVPVARPAQSPGAAAWTVFYATETGNSRRVGESMFERARSAGLAAELQDLRDYKPKALTKIANAVFIVATHGIGEAPDGSEAFFEFWLGERAPRLEGLNYSVLALGDSSYADFCAMGQVFDERLRALGASPVVDRVDCDLDFESPAADWAGRVVAHAAETVTPQVKAGTGSARLHAVPTPTMPTREHPYTAEVLVNQPITGRGSGKDVRHIELDLESSGITYLPGDSLGVLPKNPPQLVDAVIDALKLDAADEVTLNGEPTPLSVALSEHREITVISRPLLEAVARQQVELQEILSDRDRLTGFFRTHQVIDLLADYSKPWTAQELVDTLRRLTPRLYSIASSPDGNPGEAHLTVRLVQYEEFGRPHWGAASSFLAGGAREVPVFLEPNDRFRLPDDGDAPIVMIGAGTGVAPYRAFVEHRLEHGHKGDNWLVFGERHLATDFLYQLEWLRYRRDGILTRLDVAFSRDQQEKIYVQHRLREESRTLFEWLERGAHVYVCGDAERMAGDVHQALVDIVRKEGGMSDERAQEYLGELKAARRYQRDVY